MGQAPPAQAVVHSGGGTFTGDITVGGNADIVSASNNDISLLPNGTGKVVADGNGSSGGISLTDGLIEMRTGSGSVAQIDMFCEVSNAHKVSIKAPAHANYSGNVNFTLPPSNGTNGQFLKTDGSGNLSYGAVTTTGGNHHDSTATGSTSKAHIDLKTTLNSLGTDTDYTYRILGAFQTPKQLTSCRRFH